MSLRAAGTDNAAIPHRGALGRAAHPFVKRGLRYELCLPELFGKMPEAVGLQHLAVKSTKFHNPPMRQLPALRHDCGSNARRFR